MKKGKDLLICIAIILIGLSAFLSSISIYWQNKMIRNMELKISTLEHRVGELCIIEYNQSTGFDKAMKRRIK